MKFPQSPPAWQPLMDRAILQGKADVFMEFSHQENLKTDRYLHWDDFRHRASDKGGLSKEEQWAAIRMGRAMRSQSIPLLDTKGRAFTFFPSPKVFGLLREIDLHCGNRAVREHHGPGGNDPPSVRFTDGGGIDLKPA